MGSVSSGSVGAGIFAASRTFAAIEQEQADNHRDSEAEEQRDDDDLGHVKSF